MDIRTQRKSLSNDFSYLLLVTDTTLSEMLVPLQHGMCIRKRSRGRYVESVGEVFQACRKVAFRAHVLFFSEPSAASSYNIDRTGIQRRKESCRTLSVIFTEMLARCFGKRQLHEWKKCKQKVEHQTQPFYIFKENLSRKFPAYIV